MSTLSGLLPGLPELEQPTSAADPAPIADPGPLGLSAFAVTTFILSAINADIIPAGVKTVVLSVALFYGGATQLVAGIWEFRKNNTFGATAFCSYGAFWMAYWGLSVFFKPADGMTAKDVDTALGFFLLSFTIFTAIMTVAVLRTNMALTVTFGVLIITFVALTSGHFLHSNTLEVIGGWLGIATALCAFYTAMAGVVNETWKRPVLPVGKF
jgi:succinate-acetate transporter protein